jgi:hypothetical protein
MQQQLINHSPDLKKLLDEGYEFEVSGGHLIVHHIPYVTPSLEIKYGIFVCALTLATPTRTAQPQDHTMHFCGETPCSFEGKPLTSIINNSTNQQLAVGLMANHYFSSKPASGKYPDFYEKVRTYSEILSSQARAIDPAVTFRPKRQNVA